MVDNNFLDAGHTIDLNKKNDKWYSGKEEWHYSDIKNVALPYVYKVFDLLLTFGDVD
jgi:hypothetical protein